MLLLPMMMAVARMLTELILVMLLMPMMMVSARKLTTLFILRKRRGNSEGNTCKLNPKEEEIDRKNITRKKVKICLKDGLKMQWDGMES